MAKAVAASRKVRTYIVRTVYDSSKYVESSPRRSDRILDVVWDVAVSLVLCAVTSTAFVGDAAEQRADEMHGVFPLGLVLVAESRFESPVKLEGHIYILIAHYVRETF